MIRRILSIIAILLGLKISYDLNIVIDNQYAVLVFSLCFCYIYHLLNKRQRNALLICSVVYVFITLFLIGSTYPPVPIQSFLGYGEKQFLYHQHYLKTFKILILFIPLTISVLYSYREKNIIIK